jgi:hypothetical protein
MRYTYIYLYIYIINMIGDKKPAMSRSNQSKRVEGSEGGDKGGRKDFGMKIYIYAYVNKYVFIYTYQFCRCIYTGMFICICRYTCYTYLSIHVNMSVYIYMNTYIFIHMYISIHRIFRSSILGR